LRYKIIKDCDFKDNKEFEVEVQQKPRLKRMANILSKYINKDIVLLEYGCGDATSIEFIKNKMKDYKINFILADVHDNRICHKDKKFLKVDIHCSKLELENESIDIIFTSEVLEHVYNFTLTMKEFHRVLKKDGIIIISTPNFNHIKVKMNHFLFGKIDRLGGTMGDGGHRNFITQEFFRHFIKGYFEILEESGDIDLLPISNLFPRMQRLLKHRYYLYRENSKLNPLSYQYIRVIKKI